MFYCKKAYFFFLLFIIFFAKTLPVTAKSEKESDFSLSYYEQGVKLHMKGDLKSAVSYFTNALTLAPSDLPALI